MNTAKLQKNVHQALKLWHKADTGNSPLHNLLRFRQAQLTGKDNIRQLTNEILLEGLETLEVSYEEYAQVLRMRFLDRRVMHDVARRLNISQATLSRKQKEAIKHLTLVLKAQDNQDAITHQATLIKRLEAPTWTKLIGIEAHLNTLFSLLSVSTPPWVISIEGIGGIGKTTLADALARKIIDEGTFDDFGWVSARQRSFNPNRQNKDINQPALSIKELLEKLVGQLIPDAPKLDSISVQNAMALLQNRLKQHPHLIVIDNLETVIDIESLLPTIRNLANPSKFLLTTRESHHHQAGIYHFQIPELSKENALDLVRHEAELHNLPDMAQASDDDLKRIYEIVGGNPLALRLIVGQTHVHSLDVILDDLGAAQGQKAEKLYTFIYHWAWENLDELTRKAFLVMPLTTSKGASLDYLAAVSKLDSVHLHNALDHLVTLNLVGSQGGLNKRRYTIHNLTRTYLEKGVAKYY